MTHINLMIDHNFGKPVADALNNIGSVKAATTLEYGFQQHAEDKDLIASTEDNRCLFLTHDRNTIDVHRYPPCTHGGIIIYKPKKWFPESVYESVYAFCISGKRADAAHCVTHLHHDRAIIYTHDGIEEIRFRS